MQQQFRLMANTFCSHRKAGPAEALYRVIPHMHLSESNVKCVFIPTGWPENRFVHANRVSMDPEDPQFLEDPSVYQIEGRTGLYKETSTLLSKYEQRGKADNLDKLCFAQFCREYDPYRKSDSKSNEELSFLILSPIKSCPF